MNAEERDARLDHHALKDGALGYGTLMPDNTIKRAPRLLMHDPRHCARCWRMMPWWWRMTHRR